jgi:hypothetical protein
MTHDELLTLLKETAEAAIFRMDKNAWLILSDVVQLHKPYKVNDIFLCDVEPLAYPCPTIQAIEKEL